jgi:hypothetical protein
MTRPIDNSNSLGGRLGIDADENEEPWFNAGPSLLSPDGPLTEAAYQAEVAAQENRRRKQTLAETSARYIVDNLCEGFAAGEMTFEAFCRQCYDALSVDGLEPFIRQKLLGARVEFALRTTPTRKVGRSARSLWLAKLCHELVDLVHEHEHLPIARETKNGPSIFARVSQILSENGIKGKTAASVEKARLQWGKHTDRP